MDWKEKPLIAVYWLFWAAVGTLAAQEAIYLARGYGQWEWAVAGGLLVAGAKWWVTFSRKDSHDEERRISSLLTKRLLLRSGPAPNLIHGINNPDADPAFAVIVDETIGLKSYERDLVDAKGDRSLGHYVPSEIAVQLSKWPQMNAIDRKLVAVAKRIGNGDCKQLLHDIRVIIMRELYERVDQYAPDSYLTALNEIIAEVPRLSPIYRMLDAVRREYMGYDSRGIRIGSWDIVESWLEVVPPVKFEDICGDNGRPLPLPLAIIEEAIKTDCSSPTERTTPEEAVKSGVFISWATKFDVYKGQRNWQDLSLSERAVIVRCELDDTPADLDIHEFVMTTNLRRIQFDGLRTVITRVALALEPKLGVRFGSDENAKYSGVLPYMAHTALGQELASLYSGAAAEHTNYRMGELEFLAQSGAKESPLDRLLDLPPDLRLEGILQLLKPAGAFDRVQ